jgi:hypothetical protein
MSSLSTWESLGIVTQFGVTCAVAVWLGFLLGNWIDGLVGTDTIHIFGLFGALGGMISAVYTTLQVMKTLARRADARRNQGQE